LDASALVSSPRQHQQRGLESRPQVQCNEERPDQLPTHSMSSVRSRPTHNSLLSKYNISNNSLADRINWTITAARGTLQFTTQVINQQLSSYKFSLQLYKMTRCLVMPGTIPADIDMLMWHIQRYYLLLAVWCSRSVVHHTNKVTLC